MVLESFPRKKSRKGWEALKGGKVRMAGTKSNYSEARRSLQFFYCIPYTCLRSELNNIDGQLFFSFSRCDSVAKLACRYIYTHYIIASLVD